MGILQPFSTTPAKKLTFHIYIYKGFRLCTTKVGEIRQKWLVWIAPTQPPHHLLPRDDNDYP